MKKLSAAPSFDTPTASLRPGDWKMFRRFRIPEELVREAGIRRFTSEEAKGLGFRRKGVLDFEGVVFQYCKNGDGTIANAPAARSSTAER